MATGDLVSWLCEYRGGYGWSDWIPAVVVKVNPKTVRIQLWRTSGEPAERNVKPERLKPRGPKMVLGVMR